MPDRAEIEPASLVFGGGAARRRFGDQGERTAKHRRWWTAGGEDINPDNPSGHHTPSPSTAKK
jgi:hypothetical protein